MKVQVANLVSKGKVVLEKEELNLQPDEILVEAHQASVCGTDKNLFNGFLPPGYNYPIGYFGHEGGGTVVEVGSLVRDFQIGDKVISCGQNRTFADYWKAKEHSIEKVPHNLPMDIASLGEPIGCVMYSVFHSGVQIGDIVAVVGLGFAGQLMVQGAKKRGAEVVIGIDPLEGKRNLAKQLGADIVIDPTDEEPLQIIQKLSGGTGVDVVFEAAGTEDSMNLSTSLLRRGGIMALYSWAMEPVRLNISRWHDEAMDIRTTCMQHLNPPYERKVWFDRVLKPFRSELIKVRPLISATFSLDKIEDALKYACDNDEAIKVVIKS